MIRSGRTQVEVGMKPGELRWGSDFCVAGVGGTSSV